METTSEPQEIIPTPPHPIARPQTDNNGRSVGQHHTTGTKRTTKYEPRCPNITTASETMLTLKSKLEARANVTTASEKTLTWKSKLEGPDPNKIRHIRCGITEVSETRTDREKTQKTEPKQREERPHALTSRELLEELRIIHTLRTSQIVLTSDGVALRTNLGRYKGLLRGTWKLTAVIYTPRCHSVEKSARAVETNKLQKSSIKKSSEGGGSPLHTQPHCISAARHDTPWPPPQYIHAGVSDAHLHEISQVQTTQTPK